MITESTRVELRQNWAKDHEWTFVLDRDKLVMDATEKGNHFHNDIPLDQIDPYESEEKFFHLQWPMRVIRYGLILGFGFAYLATVLLVFRGHIEWAGAPMSAAVALALVAFAAAGIAFAFQIKHHRPLLRFYHRITGMELCAIFADLPDRATAEKFLAALRAEIPPWSHTFGGPSKTENVARELKALHQLRKDNVLDNEEFQFKKREMLAEYFHHGKEK